MANASPLGERMGCSCNSRARHMDQLGVAGCREHREEILAWLREEAGRRGWREKLAAGVRAAAGGIILNPLDAAGGLLDEALRRAEAAQSPVSNDATTGTPPTSM